VRTSKEWKIIKGKLEKMMENETVPNMEADESYDQTSRNVKFAES
jgi:hypothetical protein